MDTSLQHTGRFLAPLEKRSSSNGLLAPLAPIDSARNKRFEITTFTTNNPLPTPQIGLAIKNDGGHGFDGGPKATTPDNAAASNTTSFKGFTLSGKGSMFLKSNTNTKKAADGEVDAKSFGNGVKSILRDTSLTDVRSRLDGKVTDEMEDRKIVRFNLNDMMANVGDQVRSDLGVTDASSNEDEENDDWDFDGDDDDVDNGIDGGDGAGKYVKEITMTLSRNARRSVEDENEHDTKDHHSLATIFDRNVESGRIKPLYEDTDSTDSVASIKSGGNLRQITVKTQPQQPKSLEITKTNATNLMGASDIKEQHKLELDKLQQKLEIDFAEEKRSLLETYEHKRDALHNEHKLKLRQLESEILEKTNDRKIELESQHNVDVEKFKQQLMQEFDEKRKALSQEYRASEAKLQESHKILLQELERDLKSEEELIRKEHATNLAQTKDKLAHDMDMEKQRMRESGESHLYEKMRCEKRLLEDKYRCLKDKYSRLKADVKITLERRHQRRTTEHGQSMTTGSETDRTASNQPTHDIRSSSVSSKENDIGKPPPVAVQSQRKSHRDKSVERDRSAHGHDKSGNKFGVAAKYLSHIQNQQYPDDTSISQSDTTISNTFHHTSRRPKHGQLVADNGNSDSEAIQPEDNNNVRDMHGRGRKKAFTRTKSASTSRLNSSNPRAKGGVDPHVRPCTPVENLRRQLQQLEDLEDQFPDNSLDTTYHLRYPFTVDGGKEHGASSSELEFFKHRIHMERDSVRRAKESLSTQRSNFRLRQREIKHRHKSASRHTVDQMIQEEKELTEMEVNLHRTRALLGEKVIRLRHLEQSLQRLYDSEKPHMAHAYANSDNKDEATLSDLSSHSSSGFSSTDFASDTNQANGGQRREMYQESTEIIQSLENLNAEIREIWDILSKQHSQGEDCEDFHGFFFYFMSFSRFSMNIYLIVG